MKSENLLQKLGNNDVRVIVFKSADPDFFIAHFDVTAIIEWAENPTAARLVQNK